MSAGRIPVNGVDLDGTLLPYDSLRRYWRWQLGRPRAAPAAAALALLRLTGGLDRRQFAERLVRAGRRVAGYERQMLTFAAALYRDLDRSVLGVVRENSPAGTINVLCTASPQDYVAHLAERLGWEFVCSSIDRDGAFTHVYGEAKAVAFARRFPASQYEYNFAIADSKADEPLLKLFRHSRRIGESAPG